MQVWGPSVARRCRRRDAVRESQPLALAGYLRPHWYAQKLRGVLLSLLGVPHSPVMPVSKTCERCGKAFSLPPSHAEKSKYCSRACRDKTTNDDGTRTCKACGETKPLEAFPIYNHAKGYRRGICHPCECARQKRYAAVAPCVASCERCGSEFRHYESEQSRFCSRECWRTDVGETAAARRETPERACTKCGETKDLAGFYGDDFTCKACRSASGASYRARNRSKVQAGKKRYSEENAEHIRHKTRAWRARNLEYARTQEKARYERDKERISWGQLARTRNRRAKLRSIPGKHTPADIVRLWHRQRGECAYCGCRLGKRPEERAYHVDHITPLSRTELGPTNDPRNLALACQRCNNMKHAKTPAEFRLYLRRLADITS